MKRLLAAVAIFAALWAGRANAQGVQAKDVAPAFPVPSTEGLFRVQSAEPLGKGGLTIRSLTEAYRIQVGKVGQGTSFTDHVGLGFGLANGVDVGVSMPAMLDVAGGLSKYGTGDIATSLKLAYPARFPSPAYWGVAVSAILPYGYKGNEALNVRPYSRGSREISSLMMLDLNRHALGLRGNIGYLISSGFRPPGLIYGGGVELGRGQIFSFSAEYWSAPSALPGVRTERAVFGGHMNMWWLRLDAGIEEGFSKDLPKLSGMVGLEVHTSFGVKRKRFYGGRARRVPVAKEIHGTVRVAVVNFAGFKDQKTGERVASQIRTRLSQYAHIQLVDVGAETQFLDPEAARRLAEVSHVDVVITGRILRRQLDRSSQPNVPLVVGFPQTVASLEVDARVVDMRKKGEVFTVHLTGMGRQKRGVRMFPTPGDNQLDYLNVIQKERIWEDAIRQVVNELFGEVSQRFAWLPQTQ